MSLRTIPSLPDKPVRKKRMGGRVKWLLLFLLIVLLVVLFFRSSISKIKEVRWIGNHLVNQEQLSSSSGVKPGEPYFGTSASAVEDRIKTQFPFVKSVQVEKQFPGVIEVYIQEYAPVAYELTEDGSIQACLENGSVISLKDKQKLVLEKPVLTQWQGQAVLKAELSKALAATPRGLLADISEIRYYPSPSYPDRIKMYTRSGFEVVTTVPLLPDKIAYLSGVVESQSPGRITMLKADSYIPYSSLPNDIEALEGTQEGKDKVDGSEQNQGSADSQDANQKENGSEQEKGAGAENDIKEPEKGLDTDSETE
ncbi:FtsQ-type POTRA domain-containing protein [Paenibacillus alvei]|uniref:cell division protein FtsQ/DivIB n=1 Tax=Paenibacillus alvei TaxID=44250 RepID=UPI001EE64614|nr:FtsQ-type POTRA domain-containing protein [Paenibacillus alvei]MCY9540179.1 FtsQ-type POTRA domain-containing protein [Paenibacillus alvei]MCY9705612.1 FtsQ-type POTRA domain-containing protein [Paenibacillus alvei]MCY9734847.1 FtsQ-type POTRA domain-containing protein [Paenibacillus alvei]MCY9757867.1 FtsQ-type POTRA domain-containing protein [Paenibacillus alvei]MEC0082601.1 FtsQ-type POTRA domain-containing protein [Paenibacillus alvei]